MPDKDKRDNPPPIFHLIEADAKPPSFRNVGLILIGAGIITAALMYDPKPGFVEVRLKYPGPRNIQELRAASKLAPMRQCELPHATSSVSWRVLTGPDGIFTIALPAPWYRSSLDTSTAGFHDATAVFKDRSDNYVQVVSMPYASSRTYLADTTGTPIKPESECEVSTPVAGTIWSFHSRPEPKGNLFYQGYADAVTPTGKRYHIMVGSWTRARRDTLAALLAAEVLRQ